MDVEKERARNSSGRQKGASRLRSWRLRFCIGALFLCAFPFLFFGLYDGDAIASLGIFGSSYDCKGKWIYMYDLSPRFNVALLKECSWLDKDKGKSPCQRYDNRGLGPESDYGFSRGGPAIGVGTGWYQTSDSSLEQYFYERFQDYPCRTVNAKQALAFYIPFFASMDPGLRVQLQGNETVKTMVEDLLEELNKQPFLKRYNGADHFIVLSQPSSKCWRNSIVNRLVIEHPELNRVITLSPERSQIGKESDVAIPYPTSFHPSTLQELEAQKGWISRGRQRDIFVAMAASPKRGTMARTRTVLMRQCSSSRVCAMLNCVTRKSKADADGFGPGNMNTYNLCDLPEVVMSLFHRSQFCLQPPGDRMTRRSIFDAMLAGCIPVFFHNGSAHNQYFWHIPKMDEVSIKVKRKQFRRGSVVKFLAKISRRRKQYLRRNMRKYIFRVLYSVPWRKYRGYNGYSVSASQMKISKQPREIESKAGWLRVENRAPDVALKMSRGRKKPGPLDGDDAFDISLGVVLQISERSIKAVLLNRENPEQAKDEPFLAGPPELANAFVEEEELVPPVAMNETVFSSNQATNGS